MTDHERRDDKNALDPDEHDPDDTALDSATDPDDAEWSRDDFLRDLRRVSRRDDKPPRGTG